MKAYKSAYRKRDRKFKMPADGPDPVERFLRRSVAFMSVLVLVLLFALGYMVAVNKAEAAEIESAESLEVSEAEPIDYAAVVRDRIDGYFREVKENMRVLREEKLASKLEQQQEEGMEWVQDYWEYTYVSDGYSNGQVSGDPNGLNSFVGVVDGPNGIETSYSSNVLYHANTSEWTPDEYGFYRTDDGYYVVASSDYEQGTVIETSRGEAKVLDSGCASGVTDFYTNW